MVLDRTDLRILSALQKDASLSTAEIAARVGLSQSPCWRRINLLEANGVIRKRVALLSRDQVGLDVLVFSGGVGEHSAPVRAAAGAGLGFLGVRVDDALNGTLDGDGPISPPGAPVLVLVIAAREELEIAAGVRQVLAPSR